MENPAFQPDDGGVQTTESKRDTSNNEVTLEAEQKWSYIRQIFCTAIIASGPYVISFLIGSTSMLPRLLNSHTTNSNFTAEDLKWLASSPLIPSIPANFLAMYLTKLVGPTFILRGSLILSVFFYNLPVILPTLVTVWISRMALFFLTGMFDVVCIPLIVELSEPRIRGMTGSFPELTTSFGILFVFVTFTFISGRFAILCCSIPVFFGFLGSFFVPQSPYWLVQRGRKLEAAQSFARVHGSSKKEKVNELLQETIACFEKNNENDSKINEIRLLRKEKNWKPLLLTIALFGFRELGGHNVIFYYALQIFQEADISIDIFLCTIIVGVVRVGSTFLSSLFQDKLGRRTVLIGSTFISGLSLLTAGLTLYYKVSVLKIIPLIAIISLILMTGVGMGPLPFVLLGELTPSEVKFTNTAIVFSLLNIYQFAVVNVIPSVLRLFSVGPVFLAFSAVNFTASTILYFVLPETKYMTLTELENLFTTNCNLKRNTGSLEGQ